MSVEHPLKVVLCWHMHQPAYRDPHHGEYRLPWTYLHGIKDYVDMAAHLEALADARAVVNFTPTLLEQLDDYAGAIQRFLHDGEPMPDPLLNSLVAAALPGAAPKRAALVGACLRANEERLIDRFPAYRELADLGQWLLSHPDHAAYVSDQFLFDLLMWYHLAWLGETVRRSNDWVKAMQEQGEGFTAIDRRALLELIGELLSGIVPRYRALAEAGQVELSVTPYAHPIMPLLLDLSAARQAVPDLALPEMAQYPGGRARARWHIDEALRTFENHFGFRPRGCWPAEGGVCADTLQLLEHSGFQWTATGGQVLRNSLDRYHPQHEAEIRCLHRAYHLRDSALACFFRDDGLSDQIGFKYSTWHADDAVANLVHNLENIALACGDSPEAVVPIILDGENAWEYYPDNGYYFLHALYRELREHPKLELTTFAACLEQRIKRRRLKGLVAGSWVYGTFTTWIGHQDKNRAWDILGDAKRAFDGAVDNGTLTGEALQQARRQLAICEGSDWFWWFGDDNPTDSVRDFDHLYRVHVRRLYELLGCQPPEYLDRPFTSGGGTPAQGGVMRPGVQAAG
jgi:alpha-amylase/alpha-mannosidase (GH57 family)